jgi:nucleotide-binding universal stress UspA family protein
VARTLRDTHRYGYPSRQPPEVVAVLLDDGSARAVASVAVKEAVRRQAPVRFLQVISPDHDDESRSLAEEAMFRAGLRALHGHPRTHSVFEVVRSHPTRAVRNRSRDAALLVVGVNDRAHESQTAPGGQGSLADRCRMVASCPVQTVPMPAEPSL